MCWLRKILPLPNPVTETLCPNEVMKERLRIERGYEYLPPEHGTKISKNGVELELVYRFEEYRYTKYENEMQIWGEEEEGIKVVDQRWTYYSWNKMFMFWERQGGHTQISDEETFEIMKKIA